MNPALTKLSQEETHALLGAVLREVYGPNACLEGWSAQPLSKRGKHRTVHYELNARQTATAQTQHEQWVGKFYEDDHAARRVVTVLRALADVGCRAGGGLVIPRVLAYHAPCRLLLLRFEPGQSVIAALTQHLELVLWAIGRALAALHSTPVVLGGFTSPVALLEDLRPRITELCGRFPDRTVLLRQMLLRLERQTPRGPAVPSLLHGDLGPAQILWQQGRIVVLDFDGWTWGDPALDLGNLLTQLRRLKLRKPEKLPDFASLRRGMLEAYQRWLPPDPELAGRVAWYEMTTLLRKLHFLASDSARHQEAEAMQQRQAEARQLLEALPTLLEPDPGRSIAPRYEFELRSA